MDRRCSFCKAAMNHTRGAHAVSSQSAAYFCSRKCRRKGRAQQVAGEVAGIRLDETEMYSAGNQGPVDWLQLPRNVVQVVQSQLELQELLPMALSCKAWLSCVAEGRTSVRLVAGEDPRTLSNTVYLVDRLLPAVTSLSLTLPHSDNAHKHIQVVSRATRLQHLDLHMEGFANSGNYYLHEQVQCLPALAVRMTALRSLSLTLFKDMALDLCDLAHLTGLTRLSVAVHDGDDVFACRGAEEFAEALADLPLEHLELEDQLLPTVELSWLTHLTHLVVTNIDVSFRRHKVTDIQVEEYMARYCAALASLPRLQCLTLGTPDVEWKPRGGPEEALAAVRTASLLDAAQWLLPVPELRLDIGMSARMWATADAMCHLAKLANLTSLRLVITAWRECMHAGWGLAPLGALTRLRHLAIALRGFCWGERGTIGMDGSIAPADQGASVPIMREHHLRALLGPLQQLTRLELDMDPCWLWPGLTALRHVSKLRALRELSLQVAPNSLEPEDGIGVYNHAGLPREYVPPSVESLQLVGFHLL